MNYSRLALAAPGGMVASLAVGFLVILLAPSLLEEAHKYPAVFRPQEEMMAVMPIGLVATFIAIIPSCALQKGEFIYTKLGAAVFA